MPRPLLTGNSHVKEKKEDTVGSGAEAELGKTEQIELQTGVFQDLLKQHLQDLQDHFTVHESRLRELLVRTKEEPSLGSQHSDRPTAVLAVPPSEPAQSTKRSVPFSAKPDEESRQDSTFDVQRRKRISKVFKSTSEASPPKRRILGDAWDFVMGIVVVLNLIVMIIELEFLGVDAEHSLGNAPASSLNYTIYFEYFEYIFFTTYVVDTVARMFILRSAWLIEEGTGDILWANAFDAFVVLLNAVELCILPFTPLRDSDFQDNVGNAKVMKLIRLSRVLRIVRTSRLFGQLRVLLATCIASMGAFFWSILLLFMFQVIFSLVATQLLHSSIIDRSNDFQLREWLNLKYGSFFKTIYTMFEITYSGGWPALVRPVVERISPAYAILFLFYITFVVFAIIRVITALFIKETLACASNDAELAMEEKRKAAESFQTKLEDLFDAMDVDADGLLSKEEVATALTDPVVRRFLSTLEVHMNDVDFIFNLLDDGDGLLTLREFCQGLARLKGAAQASDVVVLLHHQNTLKAFCHEIYERLEELCMSLRIPQISPHGVLQSWTSHTRRVATIHLPPGGVAGCVVSGG